MSGQVPNQVPQQNGNVHAPSQMHNLGGAAAAGGGASGMRANMMIDSDLIRTRTFMQERIYDILLQRQPQLQPPTNDQTKRKFKDIVKRLEEGLFTAAPNKEDYMNLDTLESRLQNLIKRLPLNNPNSEASNNGGGAGGMRATMMMDPDLIRARTYMQERIYDILLQRLPQPLTNDQTKRKFNAIVKRLEEGLFNAAPNKEDYMNLGTLESRLQNFIKRLPLNNQNQQNPQLVNSSAPIASSVDSSMTDELTEELTELKL